MTALHIDLASDNKEEIVFVTLYGHKVGLINCPRYIRPKLVEGVLVIDLDPLRPISTVAPVEPQVQP